ncbi:MAG: cytidine deaminase [Firmicutes bacterium]|nr:cytidine deaminase [Bacillota bacterium]
MMDRKLMQAAMEARKNAVAPFSDFKVGAALLAKNGKIYRGCNMENSAFSPTLCAERAAFAAAIADGIRDFEAIAVVGDGTDYCYPCGVCRQVMAEFCDDDFKIIVMKDDKDCVICTLGELLPHAFRLKKPNEK